MGRLQNWQAVREALRFGQVTSVPCVPSYKSPMQEFCRQKEDVLSPSQLEKKEKEVLMSRKRAKKASVFRL